MILGSQVTKLSNLYMNKKTLIFPILLLAIVALSGCSRSYEKKPFFSGTETLVVCKRPYSDSTSCYNLNVQNDSDEAMTIFFENGGKIELDDMYCTETVYNDDICQGVDNEGNTWDVLPLGSAI